MIAYEQATAILRSSRPTRRATVRVPLSEAQGRVLAEDLYARVPSPPFTNAAMDGYAVVHADLAAKRPFVVDATLLARAVDPAALPERKEGHCVAIMTGAYLPPWADTVVPVEATRREDDGRVVVTTAPALGDNIRHMGEDLAEGVLVMKAGQTLRPEHVMIAAAVGHATLAVTERPRLVFLSTGDELAEPGTPLSPGAIYNSSKYFLRSAAAAIGIEPALEATLPDDPAAAARVVQALLDDGRPTVIISTGAVSAGEADFIPQVADALGFTARFHKVAIRPGKPAFFAARGDVAWLGLPGNPISTSTGWHIFARPLLAGWLDVPEPERIPVVLSNEVRKPENLRCFFRAELNEGKAWVSRRQGSASFAASISGTILVELPEGTARLPADTRVAGIIL